MCSICRHAPCLSRCPNAEPDPVAYCDICNEPIYYDEDIFEYDKKSFHEECFCEAYRKKAK